MASARGYRILLVLLVLALLGSIIAAVALGPVSIAPTTVWRTIGWHLTDLFGEGGAFPGAASDDAIVWRLRLPRVLLGVVVGAMLAVVGAALQAMVRNPLADPYVLGATAGASTGGVLVLVVAGATVTGALLSTGAVAGAFVALVLVFLLGRDAGRLPPVRLVLAGVAIGYAFTGVTSYLVLSAEDPRIAQRLLFWLAGSLGGASWPGLVLPTCTLVLGGVCLWILRGSLDTLLVGDDAARALGTDTDRVRRVLLLVTSLMVGVCVAASGGIGFVGLMIPHACRFAVGAAHARLLPVAALVGAIFLVWVDVLARTIAAPTEIPVGVITSVVGAAVFVVLLRGRRVSSGALA